MSKEIDPYDSWMELKGLYERKTAHNKTFLIKILVNLKLKSGKSMSQHLNDFQNINNKLTTMKIVIDDELQALLWMSSLLDIWETLVMTISNFAPHGVLSLDVIKRSMLIAELRKKELRVDDNSQALVIENKERSKSKGRNGHGNLHNRAKLREGKKTRTCHYYKNPDHIKKYCLN